MDDAVYDFTHEKSRLDVVEVIIVTNLRKLDHHLTVLKSVPKLQAVIVGGGDGTIVSVINALKGRDVVFGLLPLGTSNTFIKSLGLPMQYNLARRLIMKGQPRQASLGAVNGVMFANIAGMGIPSLVTTDTSNQLKKILGPVAYVVRGVKAVVKHEAFYCHVTNDEVNEGFYTHYLLLANGKYHGPLSLGREVSAYNDQLVLVAFGASDKRWHSIISLISAYLGLHNVDKRIKRIPFKRLNITTMPGQKIEADGEIISRTPATVEILKDSIKVFAKAQPPKRIAKARRPLAKRS